MEKISIKPTATEILIDGPSDDSLTETFSYDYHSSQPQPLSMGKHSLSPSASLRKLGSLFVIGHIQPNSDDTSYILSLIASLAKREYYLNYALAPKEAFSKTLKKINEALEDFFKNEEIKMNIGIFAVAGENILISKLGRFKILLARDEQTIDILNNINLFSKEHIQEKEFSNIISGKVLPEDKILAFYPARAITSREKYIKSYFVKNNAKSFTKRLHALKEEKPNFSCTAIHLTIHEHKESAIVERQQPAELQSDQNFKPVLAATEQTSFENKDADSVKLSASNDQQQEEIAPKTKNTSPKDETPLIIPSEFSTAKKSNPLVRALSGFGSVFIQVVNARKGNFPKQAILFFVILGIIATYTTLRLTLIDPSNKTTNAVLNNVSENIRVARIKITQNDVLGARQLLANSLANIASLTELDQIKKSEEIKQEVYSVLDEIDLAIEVTPSRVESLPENLVKDAFIIAQAKEDVDSGTYALTSPVRSIAEFNDNFYLLTPVSILKINDATKGKTDIVSWLEDDVNLPPDPISLTVDGNIYVLGKSGFLSTFYRGKKESEISTSLIFDEKSVILTTDELDKLYIVNKSLGRINIVNKESGDLLQTLKLGILEPISDVFLDEDETIYFLIQEDTVWKITQ